MVQFAGFYVCAFLTAAGVARAAPPLPCYPPKNFHFDPQRWNVTADQAPPDAHPSAPTVRLALAVGLGGVPPVAGDAADICRYQAANQRLRSHPRVVMMGDSITDLWAFANPALFAKDFVDRGISGQTSGQMLLRFRQDVLELRPEIVVILAGTNDLNGPLGGASISIVEDNIQSMVELATLHDIKVVLATLPPFGARIFTPDKRAAIQEVNRWMAIYAHKRGAGLADYHAVLADRDGALDPKRSLDVLHPNHVGYQAMEAQLGLALAKVAP